MSLPERLLRNIADEAGGKVTLVIGAGCSTEAPTNLPLASDLAEESHRKLLEDGVLARGVVEKPRDLTQIAEAVFIANDGAQRALVERFPPRIFKNATPNRGHELAVALLNEKSINSILTLNFDHALSSAIGALGDSNIEILYGPEDYGQVGENNLVYLHRHAGADPEDWILRAEALEEAWLGSWQEVLANRLLAVPVVAFVGLGSPADVLINSISRIKVAVADECHVCFVDPFGPDDNPFAEALDPDSAVQLAWTDFMEALAARVLREQCARLYEACRKLAESESWDPIDVTASLDDLANLGLLDLGKARSIWLLDDSIYTADRSLDARIWLADLLIAVAAIAEATDTTVHFLPGGLLEFRDGTSVKGVATFAHGRGAMRWGTLDSALLARERVRPVASRPQLIIISGVIGEPIDATAPSDILGEPASGSIVTPVASAIRLTTDQIRSSPGDSLENCHAIE